jgi:Uma2 family endonuclease
MVAAATKYLFSVEEFEELFRSGLFPEDARMELIEGEIYTMGAIGDEHVSVLDELTFLVGRLITPDLRMSIQNPILLADKSEPQPDLAVYRLRRGEGLPRRKATPAEILLVMEVAHTSLEYDRDTKLPLYGRAGIPEYWLFDVNNRRIARYTEPSINGYERLEEAYSGQSLTSTVLPGLVIAVSAVLGP